MYRRRARYAGGSGPDPAVRQSACVTDRRAARARACWAWGLLADCSAFLPENVTYICSVSWAKNGLVPTIRIGRSRLVERRGDAGVHGKSSAGHEVRTVTRE